MSPRLRLILLSLAALCVLPGVWRVAASLPAFGHPTSIYGQVVNQLGPEARHVSNMVSAVNFDFRGFDTLGEEFMLLCAVTGTVMLLRGSRGEELTAKAGRIGGRALEGRSEAVVLVSRLFGGLTMLFGIYVVLHATATPGGGFQGGVVIASSLLIVYLGEGYAAWRKLVRSQVLDAMEGGGALLFALAGLLPLLLGKNYLENVLPLGTIKDMLSGGLMLVENVGVAFAVTGGFGLLFLEFMEETRALKSEAQAEEGQ